jgi:cell division protein FtsB
MSGAVARSTERQPRTRLAPRALERARLTVVPRTRRPVTRVPFVTLVGLVLLGGVVGLLLFNTSMQQASFATTALEQQAATLAARQQTLQVELDALRSPQRVAEEARDLGMVLPAAPAFLDLRTGAVIGATGDGVREPLDLPLQPRPPVKPAVLDPQPIERTVPARLADGSRAAVDRAATGAGSRDASPARGRNGAAPGDRPGAGVAGEDR